MYFACRPKDGCVYHAIHFYPLCCNVWIFLDFPQAKDYSYSKLAVGKFFILKYATISVGLAKLWSDLNFVDILHIVHYQIHAV